MKVYVIVRMTHSRTIENVNRVVADADVARETAHELNEIEKAEQGTGRYEILTFHLQEN